MLKTTPEMRKKDLVIQELENEILIYDLKADKVFGLNETSALIWQLSNGERTMTEIANVVSQKFNSPISEEFVWLALGQLKKANLVANDYEVESDFQGATRREVIKKIGLFSLVTLPMVMSLIAPTAIQAQSTICTLTCTTIVSGGTPPTRIGCDCSATPIGQRDRGCFCTDVTQCCTGLMCSAVTADGTANNVCNNGSIGNI